MRKAVLAAYLALGLTLGAGCLASNSGGAILPARYDIGAAATQHGGSATHYGLGLSWASLWPKSSTPVDVGLGYIVETPNQTDDAPATEPAMSTYGPFLELGYRLAGSSHQRTWLAARAEWLQIPVGTGYRDGMGYTLRAAWEVFSAGKGAGYCGAIGLGVFAEGSLRQLPGDKLTTMLVAGASVRLPAVVVGK